MKLEGKTTTLKLGTVFLHRTHVMGPWQETDFVDPEETRRQGEKRSCIHCGAWQIRTDVGTGRSSSPAYTDARLEIECSAYEALPCPQLPSYATVEDAIIFVGEAIRYLAQEVVVAATEIDVDVDGDSIAHAVSCAIDHLAEVIAEGRRR